MLKGEGTYSERDHYLSRASVGKKGLRATICAVSGDNQSKVLLLHLAQVFEKNGGRGSV